MQIKPADIRSFHSRLATWYAANGRHDLPWRTTKSPYEIWVSEIMLQQTQVATVRAKYYAPFLKQFPTIEALAAAPRERVMKAWEGLGYYRRAGFLHDAAKALVLGGEAPHTPRRFAARAASALRIDSQTPRQSSSAQPTHGIQLPDSLEGLLALPGIGRNTAHAILAFGFHQPYAVMEANVKRVVARVFAQENANDAALFDYAAQLLNKGDAFDYNQAMMDLGSLVCTPKNPACTACPAAAICAGKASPEAYPAKKAKKAVPTKTPHIWVIENTKGDLFLLKRDATLLGGLYGFPQVADAPKKAVLLGEVKHAYSHFKLHAPVHHIKGKAPKALHNQGAFYSKKEIAALPLSRADQKVLALFTAA